MIGARIEQYLKLNFSAVALIVYKLINEYKTKHCIFVISN